MSMSMTDLKALVESRESGERKLPAAPALLEGVEGLVGFFALLWYGRLGLREMVFLTCRNLGFQAL